jgi:epoxyqueuosine reductase
MRLQAREALRAPRLADLAALDDAGFRALFSRTAIKRIGRDRFVRNVLYALGNSGVPDAAADARPLLADPSPTVRGAAVWALARLLEADAFEALRAAALPGESDPEVREEWRLSAGRGSPPTR